MKFREKELSLASLKLTRGLQTTLFLNNLHFGNLQPEFAFYFGGHVAFCRAWAIFMRVEFDGDCEKFYENFNFDLIEKSQELTKLIKDLVDRDIEPVEDVKTEKQADEKFKAQAKNKSGKKAKK